MSEGVFEKLYTTKQVAEIFNVTEYTVREWLKEGTLVGIKTATDRWRVTESAIKKFANSRYGETA